MSAVNQYGLSPILFCLVFCLNVNARVAPIVYMAKYVFGISTIDDRTIKTKNLTGRFHCTIIVSFIDWSSAFFLLTIALALVIRIELYLFVKIFLHSIFVHVIS